LAEQAGGITVSTLKEAEYYFEHGIIDITYAVGIVPVKMERIISLIKKGAKITLIADSVEQVQFVSAYASENKVEIPVSIEIDSDGHRSGVQPGVPLLMEIATLLHKSPGVSINGVLTHAGASYQAKSIEDIRRAAKNEQKAAVSCAELIKKHRLPCPVVSIGSTPTAVFADDLAGVTELRAGVYMFMDLVMAGLQVCDVSDIAISVLTSVIGHQKEKGWIITDGGWMALSRDRGTASQVTDYGYGLVCHKDGTPLNGMILSATNQEHGIISSNTDQKIDFSSFPIGTMLRVLPNHACATAAMHDRYHVIKNSDEIIHEWIRINGW
jgi:D-serine deaminase-like pyridoxal phosphate-dependent protein